MRSIDGGLTWTDNQVLNTVSGGHRYFPTVCATGSTAFVSWYDRRAGVAGSSNDLTAYYFRGAIRDSTVLGQELSATGEGSEDPQCLTGFPGGGTTTERGQLECTNLPNVDLATGECQVDDSGCAKPPCHQPCDLRAPNTLPLPAHCAAFNLSASCDLIRGSEVAPDSPKYGDYNGSACARGRLFMAWASATPPAPGIHRHGCSVSGRACTAATDCCTGNCVAGTCAPNATACTADTGNCTSNDDCCSQNCEGGQWSPYPNETSEHIAGSADAEGLMSLHDSSLGDMLISLRSRVGSRSARQPPHGIQQAISTSTRSD